MTESTNLVAEKKIHHTTDSVVHKAFEKKAMAITPPKDLEWKLKD